MPTKRIVMTQTLSEDRQVFTGEKEYDLDEVKADQFIRAGIALEVKPEPVEVKPEPVKKRGK